MQENKRRRRLADSHVQGALVRRVLLHWCIFFVVTALAVTTVPALNGDPGLPIAKRIGDEFGRLGVVSLTMLMLLPAFMLDTVRFSNRIVGPIARLRASLRKLGQTHDCEPIKFRGDDFWAGMADEFNHVAELVQSREKEREAEPASIGS